MFLNIHTGEIRNTNDSYGLIEICDAKLQPKIKKMAKAARVKWAARTLKIIASEAQKEEHRVM